jgi:hypothetical protein
MPNGRRDEGAPLPAANPRIESVDQFIVQTYVQTDGHSLAHRRGCRCVNRRISAETPARATNPGSVPAPRSVRIIG